MAGRKQEKPVKFQPCLLSPKTGMCGVREVNRQIVLAKGFKDMDSARESITKYAEHYETLARMHDP